MEQSAEIGHDGWLHDGPWNGIDNGTVGPPSQSDPSKSSYTSEIVTAGRWAKTPTSHLSPCQLNYLDLIINIVCYYTRALLGLFTASFSQISS